jgi:hypothetical protein
VKNRTLKATLTALVLLMSPIPGAQTFTNGWNFIRPSSCVGGPLVGLNFVFVYPTAATGGGSLVTTDPVTVALIAPRCASGDGFWVYLNGTDWLTTSVWASSK